MVKIMENPINMDDLGVPLFSETSIYGSGVSNNPKIALFIACSRTRSHQLPRSARFGNSFSNTFLLNVSSSGDEISKIEFGADQTITQETHPRIYLCFTFQQFQGSYEFLYLRICLFKSDHIATKIHPFPILICRNHSFPSHVHPAKKETYLLSTGPSRMLPHG